MKIRNLKPLHIDLGALGLLAVMSLVAYLLGVGPVIDRHRGFDLRKAELSARQSTARELSARVAQVASKITDLKQELSENAFKLQSADQINTQLARLATLTGACGLKLDQLRPDKSLNGSRYQTVPIYLVGRGSFPQCVKLLNRLQREFPDMSVASFEVSVTHIDLLQENTAAAASRSRIYQARRA